MAFIFEYFHQNNSNMQIHRQIFQSAVEAYLPPEINVHHFHFINGWIIPCSIMDALKSNNPSFQNLFWVKRIGFNWTQCISEIDNRRFIYRSDVSICIWSKLKLDLEQAFLTIRVHDHFNEFIISILVSYFENLLQNWVIDWSFARSIMHNNRCAMTWSFTKVVFLWMTVSNTSSWKWVFSSSMICQS